MVALLSAPVGVHPLCRADDSVVTDLGEFRLHLGSTFALLADLEFQDLTGLLGAVSGRGALPPQEARGDAAPLCVLREKGRERAGIASIQRFGCCTKLIDHAPRSMPDP